MKIEMDRRVLALVLIALILYLLIQLADRTRAAVPIEAPALPSSYTRLSAYAAALSATPDQGSRDDLRRVLLMPDCADAAILVDQSWERGLIRMTFDVCGIPLSGLYAPGTRGLIMVIHGTASTPEAVFGRAPDDYLHGIGRTLNDAGYAVFAPELLTEPYGTEDINSLRNALDKRLRPYGISLVGVELAALDGVLHYFGGGAVYGISLGGYLAFHLCAITDVQACGVSGYIEDRAGKLTGEDYPQPYWQVANADYMTVDGYLLRFDDAQIARLINAPLYIETGSEDPRAAYVPGVVQAMRAAGVDATNYIGQGGHETYAEAFMEWLSSPNGDSLGGVCEQSHLHHPRSHFNVAVSSPVGDASVAEVYVFPRHIPADTVAARVQRRDERGCGACERVEHHLAGLRVRADQVLVQRDRLLGRVQTGFPVKLKQCMGIALISLNVFLTQIDTLMINRRWFRYALLQSINASYPLGIIRGPFVCELVRIRAHLRKHKNVLMLLHGHSTGIHHAGHIRLDPDPFIAKPFALTHDQCAGEWLGCSGNETSLTFQHAAHGDPPFIQVDRRIPTILSICIRHVRNDGIDGRRFKARHEVEAVHMHDGIQARRQRLRIGGQQRRVWHPSPFIPRSICLYSTILSGRPRRTFPAKIVTFPVILDVFGIIEVGEKAMPRH